MTKAKIIIIAAAATILSAGVGTTGVKVVSDQQRAVLAAEAETVGQTEEETTTEAQEQESISLTGSQKQSEEETTTDSCAVKDEDIEETSAEEETLEEETTEDTTEETEEKETKKDTKETTEAETEIDYEGLTAVAQMVNYVNVRVEPNTDAEIIGKIYNNCAATIQKAVDGEDGTWYYMTSGNVTGYVKAEFFVIGEEAEALKDEIGITYGIVTAENLRVRSTPSLEDDSNILYMIEKGTNVVVEATEGEFYQIKTDEASECYVHQSCVDTWVDFDVAISLEEEAAHELAHQQAVAEAEAKAAEAAAAEKAAEEAQAAAEAAQAAAEEAARVAAQQAADAQAQAAAEAAQAAAQEAQAAAEQAAQTTDDAATATRQAVVALALSYVGNLQYVLGGDSLVTGTDCSGFTELIYAQFGYSLGRIPYQQVINNVSLDELQPGDLLFYDNAANPGNIGHVAIYIGDGQIVHACNEQYDVCVWSAYYRTPVAASRVIW